MTNALWITIAASALIAAAPGAPAHEQAAPCPDCGADGGRPDTLVAYPMGSTVLWSGTKLVGIGRVDGTVALSSGLLVLRHGSLTSGNFTVDMRQLRVTGATGADSDRSRAPVGQAALTARVFEVERYPTAAFVARSARRAGQATWSVTGDLTLHGVTRPITFLADVSWPETGHMIATSAFTISRGEWGITYPGARAVNAIADDDLRISLTLDARRRGAVVAQR